ncbi:unnamed protein product [Tilletia controversa]|uniref:Protein kinase domain-containing protein n=3 Tax=Tilletia TaxID=13289 RepID=A0A8X7MQM0_9BASI|nr:hypothetical protein CF336_g6062 [Tilletia laevis]KAE8202279.1 hypothetical protein CF328_g2302 [Tilletia controversa]KAE8256400.1 hypothetical protein A4X03_0g5401 [Tilletia caries]KAE8245088.1 hypothetical protein A4X06_0g5831 [Tilletia controversa]CAD6886276.1 unnamed protein product [Tilletia caries]
MSGPRYSTKLIYGSLPVVDDDAPSLESEQSSFCRTIFDAVESTWHVSRMRSDFWACRAWFDRDEAGYDTVVQLEDDLFELVRTALPDLIKSASARRLGALAGSQLWAEISDDVTAAERPQVILVGDIFREVMISDLPLLSDTDFPNTPRHDISVIDDYVGLVAGTIWTVAGKELDPAHVQLALKTMRIPTPRLSDPSGYNARTGAFMDELKVLTSIPPHPNVMPAPVALLTVCDYGSEQEAQRLVGWLQPVFGNFFEFIHDSKDIGAERRIKYAYELCCGVRHLLKHGHCHTDLGLENTVMAGLPPNDRVIVIDLEPWSNYHNKNGPAAPEVEGHWIVGTDKENGSVTYSECPSHPVWRGADIYTDWASMSEALERLTVFGIGSMLSVLLKIRLVFTWENPAPLRRNFQLKQPVVIGDDPTRDAWEGSIPVEVRELAQRCCAYDPRERPLLDDIVERLKKYSTL